MKNPCSGCDLCCRKYTIFTFPENAQEIASFLGISVKDFLKKYVDYYIEFYDITGSTKLSLVDNKKVGGEYGKSYFLSFSLKSDYKCTFLKDSECQIYDVRPLICRLFPNYKFYGEEFPFCKLDKNLKAKNPRKFFYLFDNYIKTMQSKGFKQAWGGELPVVSKSNIVALTAGKKLVVNDVLVNFIKKKIG